MILNFIGHDEAGRRIQVECPHGHSFFINDAPYRERLMNAKCGAGPYLPKQQDVGEFKCDECEQAGFHFACLIEANKMADLVATWQEQNGNGGVVITSGGYSPIHIGHVRYLTNAKEASGASLHIAIVNGDGFLKRKTGQVFMPFEERREIVSHINNVDFAIGWDDGTQLVADALRIIKPNFFAKGGDRSKPSQIASVEKKICSEIGCEIVYGVGGSDKPQSSSNLLKRIREKTS